MESFNGKNLLLFGDSIMYGSGNGGFGVGEYLVKYLGLKLGKYCVGGARVGYCPDKNWLVEQVRSAVTDKASADIIVFDGFTNDCCKTNGVDCDVPLGEFSADTGCQDIFSVSKSASFSDCFESVAAAFKKYFPSAKYLFVRPHKMGRRGAEEQVLYGERAKAICKKHGIAVADIYEDGGLDTFLPDQRDRHTFDSYNQGRGDCTHPNALCYEERYMPVILSALKNLTE